ncbi:hypothetical protein FB451DRAFT_1307964 [Mycena latifolia]|nr:hypothetical protein FB451DRAFT_1307964 [Mycena latifolia]
MEGHTDQVSSVAFSPDGKQTVSGSFRSLLNQIHKGWVSCLPSELLFWLPMPFRVGLWSPHNTLVIGRAQTLLSYDTFVCGTDWAKCYAPAENPS